MVRNGKSVGSLVADAVSGAEFASFWLWLAARLPPTSSGGMGQSATGQLFSVIAQSFVLLKGLLCLSLGLLEG